MSEKKEKTTADVSKEKSNKKAKAQKNEKKENIFKRMGKVIKKFFKDFKGECKKITWPTGKTVLNSSLVVLAVVAIVGLVIFGIDQGLAFIIKQLIGLSNGQDTAAMVSALFFM